MLFETILPFEPRRLPWMAIVDGEEQEGNSRSVFTGMNATMAIKTDIASIIHTL